MGEEGLKKNQGFFHLSRCLGSAEIQQQTISIKKFCNPGAYSNKDAKIAILGHLLVGFDKYW